MPRYIAEGMGRKAGSPGPAHMLPPVKFVYAGPDGETLEEAALRAYREAGYEQVSIVRIYEETN